MSAARSKGSAWPWLVAGATLGVAAGLAIGAELAHVNRETVGRVVRRLRTRPGAAGPGAAVRAAREALSSNPALAGHGLHVLPVRPGTVELHGWVSSRSERSLAMRTLRGVAGIDEVIDCLLVRGEDDRGRPPAAVGDEETS